MPLNKETEPNQTYIFTCIYVVHKYNRLIGPVGRVFANGPGDNGSIPGRVIPKTLKMVLDTSLLNTQRYKIRIKGKVAIEKGAFWSPSTTVVSLLTFLHKYS